MNTSSHDFVTVDMRGLKAALVERAREQRVNVSVVVRTAVARTLDVAEPVRPIDLSKSERPAAASETVKLSIRLSRAEAARLDSGARAAGMSRGAYLGRLTATVSALPGGPNRADQLAALIASNSQLSSLSRDIRHLTALLGRGAVRAAQEYRKTLAALTGDVHQHLQLASTVLGDLRPRSDRAGASRQSRREQKEKA